MNASGNLSRVMSLYAGSSLKGRGKTLNSVEEGMRKSNVIYDQSSIQACATHHLKQKDPM